MAEVKMNLPATLPLSLSMSSVVIGSLMFPGYDTGIIEHAYLPPELVEGVDYVYDDVMQPDGTAKRTMIRRPRP